MTSSHRSDPIGLRNRHFFITGGTGFLGRSLLDYFTECAARSDADFRVTVLSRDPNAFLIRFPQYRYLPWLTFVVGDLRNLPNTTSKYTDLIHAAADTHAQGSSLAWIDQLVDGTRHVLDFACSTNVRRFLFVSSGAVYGSQVAEVPALAEDLPQAPLTTDTSTVYAQGKRMGEHLCALYNAYRQLPCVIARCFSIISPHIPLDGPYAAGNFIRDAIAADRPCVTVQGDGSAIRTYLDGRDAAHWLLTLLEHGVPGEVYNVGSDMPVSIRELAYTVVEQLAPEKPVHITQETASFNSNRSKYIPSIARASTLGLYVETSLKDSIVIAAQRLTPNFQSASH